MEIQNIKKYFQLNIFNIDLSNFKFQSKSKQYVNKFIKIEKISI